MSVAIRLQRHGTKKKPFYKIIVTDTRTPRDGAFIEKLGHYDPKSNPSNLQIEKERLNYWISQGAITSQTVKTFLKKVLN